MDFNEFCEYMTPRLMIKTLDWQKEDIHNMPETESGKRRLFIRKLLYFLGCCCFLEEWLHCVVDLIRPCVVSAATNCRDLFWPCASGITTCCLRSLGFKMKKRPIIPIGEEVETETPAANSISRGLTILVGLKRHDPVKDIPLRTWDREAGKGTAALHSLTGKISGPQSSMLR
jgi:hypothetical protein